MRIATVTCFLLSAMFFQPAPTARLTQAFEETAAEWVRASPQMATATQYFTGEEQDRLDRVLTIRNEAFRQASTNRARAGLARLRMFEGEQLTPSERISLRTMQWHLDSELRSAPYENTYYVFNQFFGLPSGFVEFMMTVHPVRNRRDVENYIARLSAGGDLLDHAIAECRRREKAGILPPRFVLSATIEQIDRLLKPEPLQSILVTTLAERMAKVPSLSAPDREPLREAAAKAVAESVNRGLKRAAQVLTQQLDAATNDAGLWRLPNGLAAYADRLRVSTTTAYTAEQIHQIGLEQVSRLEKQMDGVLKTLGYQEGTVLARYNKAMQDHSYPQTPDVRDRILADYTNIMQDAQKRADAFFDIKPKAGVVVQRVPEFREKETGAAYYTPPAKDGSRPGTFFVPLPGPVFGRLDMRSRSYHEAVPGHHFQIALEQEDEGLPRFRRSRVLSGSGAYGEGWGLYVELLALEGGWYEKDIPGRLGALERQLWRAKRLVVDTGLHAKRWTRQQAIDYGMSPAEVDRYIVMPGQACSYMIGQLKILELRDKAKRELGDRFNIKDFHRLVLRTGSVPLEVLTQVVEEYIAARRA